MHRYDIDEAAAFAMLRRLSQMQNIKLHLIADNIVRTSPYPRNSAGGCSCPPIPPVPARHLRPRGTTWVHLGCRMSTPSPAPLRWRPSMIALGHGHGGFDWCCGHLEIDRCPIQTLAAHESGDCSRPRSYCRACQRTAAMVGAGTRGPRTYGPMTNHIHSGRRLVGGTGVPTCARYATDITCARPPTRAPRARRSR